MCIIIAKEKGKKLPSETVLKKCWEANPEGGGFMFNSNKKVIIEKGFMKFNDFYNRLIECDLHHNLKKSTLIIHFRVATSGLVDNGNCHPYPITNDINLLRKTEIECEIGVAHNGVIREYNEKNNILNDTQMFIIEVIEDLISNTKKGYYKTKTFKKIMESMINESRLVLLNAEGEMIKIGNWIEENGLYFSNNKYKTLNTLKSSKYRKAQIFENELKYLEDDFESNDKFYIDDMPVEEEEFNLIIDTLTCLDTCESVYSMDYLQEYNCFNGEYLLDEEEKIIYEKDGRKLYYLGEYLTREECIDEF